ncbi:hypothetical protein F5Y10DRAFT_265667 [Nemania abortiva]|nr:hypothetical protein F5Y10DRAFT_265667 [Nemania abortiva]
MKSFLLATLAAVTGLSSAVSAFSVTNCDNGSYKNFGHNADGHCRNWTADELSYSSEHGCTLTVYSGGNCSGTTYTTTLQHTCFKPPFGVQSVKCS